MEGMSGASERSNGPLPMKRVLEIVPFATALEFPVKTIPL
jgi:hypothetical protein